MKNSHFYHPKDRQRVDIIQKAFKGHAKHSLKNAYRYLFTAQKLRVISPEGSLFIFETAREEAATAVLILLNKLYGMNAKTSNHQHKHGVIQFVYMIQRLMAARKIPRLVFHIENPKTTPKLTFLIHMNVGGHELCLRPESMADLKVTANNGKSFIDWISSASGFSSVDDYVRHQKKEITKNKNLRNKAIYADDHGIPSCDVSPEAIDRLRGEIEHLFILAMFLVQGTNGSFQEGVVPVLKTLFLLDHDTDEPVP